MTQNENENLYPPLGFGPKASVLPMSYTALRLVLSITALLDGLVQF